MKLSTSVLKSSAASTNSSQTSPLAAMSKATAECGPTAKAYGTCVASLYEDISKGACQSEFEAFKNCVTSTMKRKW